MAKDEHLRILLAAISSKDVSQWNDWRQNNPHLVPDLTKADLQNTVLRGADLSASDLRGANLSKATLAGAKLGGAKFIDADLRSADLTGADLKCAHLQRADLTGADLTRADLRFADLRGTNLTNALLYDATVEPAALRRAINPIPDVPEARVLRPRSTPGDESPGRIEGPEWLKNLIKRGVACVARLAPRLFERQDVTTLGLSRSDRAKKDQPDTSDSKPQGSE